ncbi:MAG: hypothetical protein RL033_4842 [Pseudomonadota bacterium]|jgi:hypothetical protein
MIAHGFSHFRLVRAAACSGLLAALASCASSTTGGALGSSESAAQPAVTEPSAAGAALCPGTAQLCEDFESGGLDGWTKLETGGTLTLDSAHAFSGTSALLVDIPPNQRGGFIESTGAPLFPLPSRAMWGRVMVYFESVPDGHSDVVRGAALGGGVPWYNVGEQHGEILLNYYSGAPSDCWARPSPGKPVPIASWSCWEWIFDGSANELVFWIDGQLSRQVSALGDGCVTGGNQVWSAPEFQSLRIGEFIAQPSAVPTRLWLDAVAVSTTGPVGCPAAQ